jgi:hypothetical protein
MSQKFTLFSSGPKEESVVLEGGAAVEGEDGIRERGEVEVGSKGSRNVKGWSHAEYTLTCWQYTAVADHDVKGSVTPPTTIQRPSESQHIIQSGMRKIIRIAAHAPISVAIIKLMWQACGEAYVAVATVVLEVKGGGE